MIGEAATKISSDFKDTSKQVDWKSIIGIRNKIIHEYFDINIESDLSRGASGGCTQDPGKVPTQGSGN